MPALASPRPDFEAQIRFLSSADGGRSGPCRTGYFPNHDFGIPGILNDARHTFPDVEEVQPGDTVKSQLTLVDPAQQRGRLYKGFTFTVQEGRRIVGHGRITKVLNRDLRRA